MSEIHSFVRLPLAFFCSLLRVSSKAIRHFFPLLLMSLRMHRAPFVIGLCLVFILNGYYDLDVATSSPVDIIQSISLRIVMSVDCLSFFFQSIDSATPQQRIHLKPIFCSVHVYYIVTIGVVWCRACVFLAHFHLPLLLRLLLGIPVGV